MADEPAEVTAAYWVHSLNPPRFMWNCEACPALGQSDTEPDAVRAMNGHVTDEHPAARYVPTPVPGSEHEKG